MNVDAFVADVITVDVVLRVACDGITDVNLYAALSVVEALQAYFGQFGDISECMIMRDPVTRRSR